MTRCPDVANRESTARHLSSNIMKEILYVQAGRLSNYTGTHFWNTQECYLSSDYGEAQVDPSISFCESIDSQVRADPIIFFWFESFDKLGVVYFMPSCINI